MYGGAPYEYDIKNICNSVIQPSTMHVKNTGLANFFKRYLLQKAISVFKWTVPEHWDRDYFLYVLYTIGFEAIVNTNKFGVIPQMCGLMGYNVFYRPTNAVISNPLLRGILQPKINIQCTVLKLQPDYCGIYDLVDYYGDMMAIASETIATNLVNSKLSYVFMAGNKTAAESFKKMFDQIIGGELAVVIDKNLLNADGSMPWQMFEQNVGNNYIVDKVLSDLRKIEAEFDTKIGIPNANTDKKERLISDEVNANNTETKTLCELWLESLKDGVKRSIEMFPVLNGNFSVDWRDEPDAAVNTGIIQS